MNLQCKQLRQGYIVILPFDQVTLQSWQCRRYWQTQKKSKVVLM